MEVMAGGPTRATVGPPGDILMGPYVGCYLGSRLEYIHSFKKWSDLFLKIVAK